MALVRSFIAGWLSFRGLYSWLDRGSFLFTVLIAPFMQVTFFALMGKYAVPEIGAGYLVLGQSLLACSYMTLYGGVMLISYDKWEWTAELLVASPVHCFRLLLAKTVCLAFLGWVLSSILYTVSMPLYVQQLPDPLVYGLLGPAMLSSAAFGVWLGTIALFFYEGLPLADAAYLILFVTSGTAFPTNTYPDWLSVIGALLPFHNTMKVLYNGGIPTPEFVQILVYIALAGITWSCYEFAAARWDIYRNV